MKDPGSVMIPTTNGAWGRYFNSPGPCLTGAAALLCSVVSLWSPVVAADRSLSDAGPPVAMAEATQDLEGGLRLLAFGDSLVAGYGLAAAEGFTAQLEAALQGEGWNVSVLDGGVSGDTTAGGRSRLDWVLADNPDAVLVALGANDGLRGLDPEETRRNLNAIIRRFVETEGLPTLLAGMYAPPNLGRDYETAFNGIYTDLAADYEQIVFFPFFLEDVAMVGRLNQNDGIHPNAEGVAIMVNNLLPQVVQILSHAVEQRVGLGADAAVESGG